SDVVVGGAGNDRLIGGGGADRLVGGDGLDTASYGSSSIGVFVNLATGLGNRGDADGDKLKEIENIAGSAHNDVLVGDDGATTLNGGAGNDILAGRGGDALL